MRHMTACLVQGRSSCLWPMDEPKLLSGVGSPFTSKRMMWCRSVHTSLPRPYSQLPQLSITQAPGVLALVTRAAPSSSPSPEPTAHSHSTGSSTRLMRCPCRMTTRSWRPG